MSALSWITSKAKSIRRGHKTMSWKSAIKKAGAEYRASHKAKPARTKKVVRKKAKRVSHAKRPAAKRKVSGNYSSKRQTSISGFNSEDQKNAALRDYKHALSAVQYRTHAIDRFTAMLIVAKKEKMFGRVRELRKVIRTEKMLLSENKKFVRAIKKHL